MPSRSFKIMCRSLLIGLLLLESLCAAGEPGPGRVTLATAGQGRALWRYTLSEPAEGWQGAAFDDSQWKEGAAGFGGQMPNAPVATQWDSREIWLRGEFERQGGALYKEFFRIWHSGDVEIHVNGEKVLALSGSSSGYVYVPAQKPLPIRDGAKNTIAVYCRTGTGPHFIDAGIFDTVHPVADALKQPRNAEDVVRLQKPLFDHPMRDMGVQLGHDNAYYMTATAGSPDCWGHNDGGIPVWRSEDLKNWQSLGVVWSFKEAAPWLQRMLDKRPAALWAPELHYLKGNYYIVFSTNHHVIGLLRSKSGKAEGPYENATADAPLAERIDASLFQDDDGTVYLIYQNGYLARMKEDMSGLAEKPRKIATLGGHDIGFEGVSMFKANGYYYISCAENVPPYGYSSVVARSEKIEGPYGEPHVALPHGGHNNYLKDREGQWWGSLFGFDGRAPFYERPGLVRVTFDEQGRVLPTEANDKRLAARFVLVPMADKGTLWRYTSDAPNGDWAALDFEDRNWTLGLGSFGTPGTKEPTLEVRTGWSGRQLWLRKEFQMPELDQPQLRLSCFTSGKCSGEVYLNGIRVDAFAQSQRRYLPEAAKKALRTGRNVLALKLECEPGRRGVDVGLVVWSIPVK